MVEFTSLLEFLLILGGIGLVSSKTLNESLRNQHLIIEGEYWPPFFMFDRDEDGIAINYGGAMWDLLLFMQRARNFTFTLVTEADGDWGYCYAIGNCTGMIGMVNRKEVDFALGDHYSLFCGISFFNYSLSGPFTPTHLRSMSVDFSSGVSEESYSIVVPLRIENDIWSFANPFNFEVWIFSLLSIPIFILTLGLAEYLTSGTIFWGKWIGFVLRNVLSETSCTMPDRKNYQKFLITIWTFSSFLLVMAYAGNLTAMITRPKIVMQYENLEDLLNQDELSLVVEDGLGVIENMRQTSPDSVFHKLIDKTERMDTTDYDNWPSGCFKPAAYHSKKHASICDIHSTNAHLSDDYSANGKCNWYTTKSKFFDVPIVMAFQVFSDLEENT